MQFRSHTCVHHVRLRWLMLLTIFCSARCQQSITSKPAALSDDDLVLAFGTCEARMRIVWASRAWRGNIRTVIALDNQALADKLTAEHSQQHNEFYVYYPDTGGKTPGDRRVALVPWFVHKMFAGTYKWILYGDDDTVWFPAGVKSELADYDHKLPYLVTDEFFAMHRMNHPGTPRCLPCHRTPADLIANKHTAAGSTDLQLDLLKFPPIGCPCTPELACSYAKNLKAIPEYADMQKDLVLDKEHIEKNLPEGYPTDCEYPTSYGGSGLLISAGALETVSYDQALFFMAGNSSDPESQAKRTSVQDNGRCDRLISLCFWMHGIALTDPGYHIGAGFSMDDRYQLMNSWLASPGRMDEMLHGDYPHFSWVFQRLTTAHLSFMRKQLVKKLGNRLDVIIPEMALYSEKLGQAYTAVHAYLQQIQQS